MSLIIPGLGRTITFKPRRPRPKPAGGKVTANPYVTDNKPKPKLGSKPRRKVAPVRGAVDNKPKPRTTRAKASGKRGCARPMSSAPRRPRGRR